MKTLIRVLAIIGFALVLLSALGTGVCILLQKPLVEMIYGSSIATAAPVVPVSTVAYLLLATVTLGLLCLAAGNRRIGIWSEIVLGAMCVVVVPGVQSVLAPLEALVQSRYATVLGTQSIIAASAVRTLCGYAVLPAGLGFRLALVAIGMSLVYKIFMKRRAQML